MNWMAILFAVGSVAMVSASQTKVPKSKMTTAQVVRAYGDFGKGVEFVTSVTEEAYTKKMRDWQHVVNAALR